MIVLGIAQFHAEELELKAKLEGQLPVEQDLSRWHGVFDARSD